MQLSEAVRLFLRSCNLEKNLSAHTLRAYAIDLQQLIQFATSENVASPTLFSSDFFQRYIEDLKFTRQHRDSSIRRKIGVLRSFIRFLGTRDLVKQNPLAGLRLNFRQEKRLPSVLSRQEVGSILISAKRLSNSAIDSSWDAISRARNYAFLELLFYTGARVGEILKLDISDCDLERGLAWIKGKGRRERIVYIGFGPVIAALKRYLRLRRLADPNESAVFLNRYGSRLSTNSAERIVRRCADSAGIRSRVTPHIFRHTMATMMLENGADLRSIQEILGHASIATTEIYTHVSADRKRQVMSEFHPRRFLSRLARAG